MREMSFSLTRPPSEAVRTTDFLKFLDRRKSSLSGKRIDERAVDVAARARADGTYRGLLVLALYRRRDILYREAERGDAHGVEPDTDAVLSSVDLDFAHAGDALEAASDVRIGVVHKLKLAVGAVRRGQREEAQSVGERSLDRDAFVDDLLRQLRLKPERRGSGRGRAPCLGLCRWRR